MSACDAQAPEQLGQFLVISYGDRRYLGFAGATPIVTHDAILLSKYVKLLVPHAAISYTSMNQHQRMPLASHYVVKLRTIDSDEAGLCVGLSHMSVIPFLRVSNKNYPFCSRHSRHASSSGAGT